MQRRTLDIIFSIGGILLAALLLVLGLVLNSEANFAEEYVRDQLTEQQITFLPVEALDDEEREKVCVVDNAGEPLTTGRQAECYANDFIGLHLESIADGLTFAELGSVQRELRGQVEEAEATNDPALAELEEQLDEVTQDRQTVFQGETLRGLLLTSYGFSELGSRAGQASNLAFGGAALLTLLSIAGFVHAFRTPPSRTFAAPEPADRSE